MNFPIYTAVLLLALGTTASAYAQQGNGQEEHKQEAKPAKQQARPAHEQRQDKPAARQQTRGAQPAQQQPTRQATPAHSQRTQQANRAQQPPAREANRTQQSNSERNQPQARQTYAANGNAGNRGRSEHGRISDDHYASSFGREHSFHVSRGDYDSRRFAYGGYSFGFVDPWPVAWGYSDDVYVVYADGGYYMYNRVHPGLRISINIF